MPETYNANDVIEVQIIGQQYGHEMMNVRFFRVRSATITALLVAAELNNNWVSFLRGITANTYTWTRYQIRRVIPGSPTAYEGVLGSMFGGIASAGEYSRQDCNLWALKTGFEPIRRPGRMYLPAIPGGTRVNDQWVGSYVVSNQNAITSMLNRYGPAGVGPLQLVLVRRQGDVYDETRAVTEIVHRQYPATQRRRRNNIANG